MLVMTEDIIIPNGFKRCECGYCIDIIHIFDSQGRYRRFKRGHASRMENHPQWLGGKKFDGHGYVEIRKRGYFKANKKGYVKEHIFVFQEYYQCCMLKWGHVHHINEIRYDNRIENLEGMTNAQHARLHKKKDMSDRKCLLCNSDTTYTDKDGYPHWCIYENGFICKSCGDRRYHQNKKLKKYCMDVESTENILTEDEEN